MYFITGFVLLFLCLFFKGQSVSGIQLSFAFCLCFFLYVYCQSFTKGRKKRTWFSLQIFLLLPLFKPFLSGFFLFIMDGVIERRKIQGNYLSQV